MNVCEGQPWADIASHSAVYLIIIASPDEFQSCDLNQGNCGCVCLLLKQLPQSFADVLIQHTFLRGESLQRIAAEGEITWLWGINKRFTDAPAAYDTVCFSHHSSSGPRCTIIIILLHLGSFLPFLQQRGTRRKDKSLSGPSLDF